MDPSLAMMTAVLLAEVVEFEREDTFQIEIVKLHGCKNEKKHVFDSRGGMIRKSVKAAKDKD